MTPAESTQVILELERVRGTLETGFARTDGSLALLVQRSDQTDRALTEHGNELKGMEKRVDALEADVKASSSHDNRLAAVERQVWIGFGMAILCSTAGGWLLNLLVK